MRDKILNIKLDRLMSKKYDTLNYQHIVYKKKKKM